MSDSSGSGPGWEYVPFSHDGPCNVGGVATRGGRTYRWRRYANGRKGATLTGDGEFIVHHYTGGSATDCGVDLYNERVLRRLTTNWQCTPHAVTCQRC